MRRLLLALDAQDRPQQQIEAAAPVTPVRKADDGLLAHEHVEVLLDDGHRVAEVAAE